SNAIGTGPASNPLSATPATTPGAPTLNSATAGTNSVSLVWAAPLSNGGSAVTNYKVYRSTTSRSEVLLTTLGNVTTFTDTGLTAGITYFYKRHERRRLLPARRHGHVDRRGTGAVRARAKPDALGQRGGQGRDRRRR